MFYFLQISSRHLSKDSALGVPSYATAAWPTQMFSNPHNALELKLLFLIFFFFFFGYAGSLLLHRLFSSCSEGGYSLVAACRLLIVVTSLVVEHGL